MFKTLLFTFESFLLIRCQNFCGRCAISNIQLLWQFPATITINFKVLKFEQRAREKLEVLLKSNVFYFRRLKKILFYKDVRFQYFKYDVKLVMLAEWV